MTTFRLHIPQRELARLELLLAINDVQDTPPAPELGWKDDMTLFESVYKTPCGRVIEVFVLSGQSNAWAEVNVLRLEDLSQEDSATSEILGGEWEFEHVNVNIVAGEGPDVFWTEED